MELSMSLATQIGALFIMIGIGYFLVKRDILRVQDTTVLSHIVLYVCAPCAIINSFQIDLTQEKLQGFLLSIVAAIIINGLFIIITEVLGKIFHFIDVEKMSIVYSNCGNLIIPLVSIVLGEEMVFYTSGYMIVQTILMWTHCKFVMSQSTKFDIKAIIFNINIIAIFLGMILFFTGIKTPVLIKSAMTSMSALMGPLSMFTVGMLLTEMNLKEVFTNKRAYLVCFIRLIVLPVIILGIIVFSGSTTLLPSAPSILMISLLAASAPSASTVTQFAELFHNKPIEASLINALSVLLCIITMPIINIIYTTLIGL